MPPLPPSSFSHKLCAEFDHFIGYQLLGVQARPIRLPSVPPHFAHTGLSSLLTAASWTGAMESGELPGVGVQQHRESVGVQHHIPVFWLSGFLTEEFWAVHVNTFGAAALHVPKAFVSTSVACGPLTRSDQACFSAPPLGTGAKSQFRWLSNDLASRGALWRHRRPRNDAIYGRMVDDRV